MLARRSRSAVGWNCAAVAGPRRSSQFEVIPLHQSLSRVERHLVPVFEWLDGNGRYGIVHQRLYYAVRGDIVCVEIRK